ncbi:MAG TPA: pilin [bacterium]|nr:pilin [bacterium]
MPNIIQAADTYSDTLPKEGCLGGPKENIRMQVFIPGVTKSLNGCYYVESDLPALIQQLYKFVIAVIAVLAFIMITVGGFKWILAAGNAGTIQDAKATITSAVSGLILALLSYLILQTINPNLINLKMTTPEPVNTQEFLDITYCTGLTQYYQNNTTNPTVIYDEGHWGDSNYGYSWSDSRRVFICGKKYEYGYEKGGAGGGNKIRLGTCIGGYCEDTKVCFTESGFSYCVDFKDQCYKQDHTTAETCANFNEMIYVDRPGLRSGSCFKQVDNFWKITNAGDQCEWGNRLFCPSGWQRTSCLSGKQYDKTNISGCWMIDDGIKKPFRAQGTGSTWICADSIYANNETSSYICCKNESADEYKRAVPAANYNGSDLVAETITCASVKNCADYKNYDTCSSNVCALGGACVWKSAEKKCQ